MAEDRSCGCCAPIVLKSIFLKELPQQLNLALNAFDPKQRADFINMCGDTDEGGLGVLLGLADA